MKHFKDGQIVAYIPLGANDMFYKVEVGKIKKNGWRLCFCLFSFRRYCSTNFSKRPLSNRE